MAPNQESVLKLPLTVVSKVDIARLLREVQAVDDFLAQAAVRKPGTAMQLPRSSQMLEELAKENHLNLLQADDRKRVLVFLEELKARAPQLHISFAADPSPVFTGKLMLWLRTEIHPLVLLHIGLQPSIAAGCIVRTPNKHFDFSLRQHLQQNRPVLMQKIRGAVT